jgi:hypothetical protein
MTAISKLPKWSTPERRQCLVDLFTKSGGFCVFGHKKCHIAHHHYTLYIDDLIAEWKQADREQRQAEWLATFKAIHSLGERKFPLHGQFSAVSREIWGGKQPLYYIQNLGISGLTFKPFAKVRISSSYMSLYVDLNDTLRQVSKNRRRKALRYGKPLPKVYEETVIGIVREAVNDYMRH